MGVEPKPERCCAWMPPATSLLSILETVRRHGVCSLFNSSLVADPDNSGYIAFLICPCKVPTRQSKWRTGSHISCRRSSEAPQARASNKHWIHHYCRQVWYPWGAFFLAGDTCNGVSEFGPPGVGLDHARSMEACHHMYLSY